MHSSIFAVSSLVFLFVSCTGAQLHDINSAAEEASFTDYPSTGLPPLASGSSLKEDLVQFPTQCLQTLSYPIKLPQLPEEFQFNQYRRKWLSVPKAEEEKMRPTREYNVHVAYSRRLHRGAWKLTHDSNRPEMTESGYRCIDLFGSGQVFEINETTKACDVGTMPKDISCSPYAYYLTREAGYGTDWNNGDDSCHYASTPLVILPADKSYNVDTNQQLDAFVQCVWIRYDTDSNAGGSFWRNMYQYDSTTGHPVQIVAMRLDDNQNTDIEPMAYQEYNFENFKPFIIDKNAVLLPPDGTCCPGWPTATCQHIVTTTTTVEEDDDDSSEIVWFTDDNVLAMKLFLIVGLPLMVVLIYVSTMCYKKQAGKDVAARRQRMWQANIVNGSADNKKAFMPTFTATFDADVVVGSNDKKVLIC